MSSPESPRTGLRRRSQANGASSFFTSPAAAPASPDGFGAFVSPTSESSGWGSPRGDDGKGAGEIEDPGLFESFDAPPKPSAPSSASAPVASADDEWEWAEAGPAGSLSPLTESTPVPPQPKVSNLPDWDAWLQDVDGGGPSAASPGIDSNRNGGGSWGKSSTGGKRAGGSASRGTTPAALSKPDDDFFAAFERAAIEQQATRAPSPPIIDLRATERKLAGKPPASEATSTEDDFFSRFERSPQEAMADASRRKREEQEAEALRGPQLDSMKDAQASPLDMTPRGGRERSRRDDDYFGGPEDAQTSQSPANGGAADPGDHNAGAGAAPSSWTGSLRRTWSNLRGMSGELVNHLPSTTDFLVPADDYEYEAARAAQAASAERRGSAQHSKDGSASSTTSSPTTMASPLPAAERPKPALAHTSDYAHSTPFGGSSSYTPTSQRRNSRSMAAPISGAPGFVPSRSQHWNTGSWTLDSSSASERSRARSIPVTLLERRDETDEVVDAWHAARVHAALPPRLQLGRSWRLMYSMDQHGMSLGTLYHRVAAGMDPSRRRGEGSGNVNETEAEGWLRGASGAARAAMGAAGGSPTRVRHVGGGLDMKDAGLVVAVKDADGNVFGAFVNERIRPQAGYYGSGECFLWRTAQSSQPPSPVRAATDPSDASAPLHPGHCIESYRWTGRNDYMVLTEAHYLSFGGGDGKYGLWVDAGLEKGISARCPAFANEVLCQDAKRVEKDKEEEDGWGEKEEEAEEGEFECMGLEVWAVGVD